MVYSNFFDHANHLFFDVRIHKVILFSLYSVIYAYKHGLIWKDCYSYHWFIKTYLGFRLLINHQDFRYFDIINNISFLIYENDKELAIILISNCKDASRVILLNHVYLQVFSCELVTPYLFVGTKTITLDFKQFRKGATNSYQLLTVISYNHANYIQMRLNIGPLCKIIKYLMIWLKHLNTFYLQQLFLLSNMSFRL